MKKSLKMVLSGLFLCSALLLSACASPDEYLITAKSSDSILGSVVGASEINTNKKAEGTNITLIANQNYEENPFICWIKDYQTVVSNEKELNLTYNSLSAGNYTAVFAESSCDKMLFASLSEIEFEPNDELVNENGYSIWEYQVEYSNSLFGVDNYYKLTDGTSNIGESPISTDNRSTLYLGSAGINNNFIIRVNLTLKNQSGDNSISTLYEFYPSDNNTNNNLNKETFGNSSSKTIEKKYPEGTLSLTFTKLDKTTNFGF